MKNNIKQFSIYIITTLLILGGVVLAGTLAPTGGNTSTSTMYTLTDIYNKLTAGTSATEGNHIITTSGTPAISMNTLKDIYDSIPAYITLDDSTTTIPFGIYATTTLDSIDTDLVAGNIVEGATIFGVEGNVEVGGGTSVWDTSESTGLIWTANQGIMNWDDAKDACIAVGGRLPLVAELTAGLSAQFESSLLSGFTEYADYWAIDEVSPSQAYYCSGSYSYPPSTAGNVKSILLLSRCVR